ncbi:MAG: hypothetical protein V7L28_21155 [Nostoc sp.]
MQFLTPVAQLWSLISRCKSSIDLKLDYVEAISGLGYYSLRFGHNWQQEYPKLRQWFEVLHQRQSVV